MVLAGGRSSRMGTNKALLDFQGLPLVEHMMDLLRQSGLEDIYISGDLDGYETIADQTPHAGPARAIADVMQRLGRYDGVLFVPVDMPFLCPEVLRALTTQEGGAHYEGWPLPLYLPDSFVPDSGADSVKGMIADRGVSALSIPGTAQDCFININTQQEWREASRK